MTDDGGRGERGAGDGRECRVPGAGWCRAGASSGARGGIPERGPPLASLIHAVSVHHTYTY